MSLLAPSAHGSRLAFLTAATPSKETWFARVQRVVGASRLVAYWLLDDPAGSTTARDWINRDADGKCRVGTHQGGVTPGVTGIGDGLTATSYNGAGVTFVYQAVWAARFNAGVGAAGTMIHWAQVSSAAVWTDLQSRRPFVLYVNAGNRIFWNRGAANNQITFNYVAGGVASSPFVNGISYTTPMLLVATWDRAAGASGEVKAYINGAQIGSTMTGLGTWAGNLDVTVQTIGASNGSYGQPWSGTISHVILVDYALTPTQVAALYPL